MTNPIPASLPPGEAGVPEEPLLLDQVVEEVQRLEKQETGWIKKVITLALTLVLFVVFLGLLHFDLLVIAMLVGVVYLHELGHALAMNLLGYRNVRIFFIPLFGAAASGRKTKVSGWREAIVSMAGPLPGIAIGLGLGGWYLAAPDPILGQVTLLFIALNAFQLLPFFPLDGGRFFNEILFVRSRHVEAASKVVAGILFLLLGWYMDYWIFMGLGAVVLFTSTNALRLGKATEEARTFLEPPRGEEIPPLTETDAALILPSVMQQFPMLRTGREFAPLVKIVWDRANTRPPGIAASAALMMLYAAALAVVLLAGGYYVHLQNNTAEAKLRRGTQALREGDLPRAERLLAGAIDLSTGRPPDDPLRSEAQLFLARAFAGQGNFERAEPLQRDALVYLEEHAPVSLAHAEALEDYAATLAQLNRMQEAQRAGARAIAIRESYLEAAEAKRPDH